METEAPRLWELGASLRGAGDELGLVAGDVHKSMTTYVLPNLVQLWCQGQPGAVRPFVSRLAGIQAVPLRHFPHLGTP
jgi:hypothetical protein